MHLPPFTIEVIESTSSSELEVKGIPMESRSIGEVARRMGMGASAIRAAKSVGFTIAEMQTLVSAGESQGRAPRDWRRFMSRKVEELDGVIQRARTMKQVLASALACGCWDDLDMPLDSFIESLEIVEQPGRGSRAVRAGRSGA
jgi:DNA-binding transcriptional MerR regulator